MSVRAGALGEYGEPGGGPVVDLFRFVEHDFAVPRPTSAIDVANDSTFQRDLADAGQQGGDAATVRELASAYLASTFDSPTSDPTHDGGRLLHVEAALRALNPVSADAVAALVQERFGADAATVVAGADFAADLELLQNTVLAVKLVTGFDRVDLAHVVRQLRAAAFLTHLADQAPTTLGRARLHRLLDRPLRIPAAPLAAAAPAPDRSSGDPAGTDPTTDDTARYAALRRERDGLQHAYDAVLALPPTALVVAPAGPSVRGDSDGPRDPAQDPAQDHAQDPVQDPAGDEVRPASGDGTTAGPVLLRPSNAAIRALQETHGQALSGLRADLASQPIAATVTEMTSRLTELNHELLPLEHPTSAPIYRVGGHVFADPPVMHTLDAKAPAPDPVTLADFSTAVTRPVGFGNLQVVRQELVGYVAGEISHIENVLEGEELHRRTRRVESTETISLDETVSTQSQERDQQSTDHNELSTETQKESGSQSSRSGPGMTSSDYGKLVENSKSNFAQTVVASSVESLTQQVRQQRVQRESRRYVEQVRHVLDNHDGTTKIRGIYQWVDKKYSLRVLNYGRRLMYDVVVPEPAAVLVQALKDSVQPESFQLSKPLDPGLVPYQLNASNYMWYASQYGVSGAVAPPPAVFDKTVSQVQLITGTTSVPAYGSPADVPARGAFKLVVPDGYKAVHGYAQQINAQHFDPPPGRTLEVLTGESYYVRLMSPEHPFLSASFTMNGETGELPVTYRTFDKVISLAFAVGIVCQRTDEAYGQWQLKTHAAIVAGYQRQLADYEDKLGRYVAAARAQLAAAGGLAHDPAVTVDELKRAFVFLLLGEHAPAWLPTPTPAPAPPSAVLPDPLKVKQWGAMVAFFERAFEWENLMYTWYPYFWGRPQRWEEMLLTQDADPEFEGFLKAGAARVVVPVRPGFEAALAHYQETGDVWMGEEMPDMFGDDYVSIIEEIKAANRAPGDEVCVQQWEVTLPTTLVLLRDDATLPSWTPTPCPPGPADV